MATAKQIEANRLNALLSTGPKTDAGKAAARRNALKHGLAGAGIVMPIELGELVQERTDELCSSLKPWDAFDMFLTEEVALEQLRGERCRRLERARMQRLAEDALDQWDEHRVIAAEQLGTRLSKEPALCARLLQRTLQGCDWLLARWRGLGCVLEGGGAWDHDQRRLALDLLGTPPELRRGGTPLDPSRGAATPATAAIPEDAPSQGTGDDPHLFDRKLHHKDTESTETDTKESESPSSLCLSPCSPCLCGEIRSGFRPPNPDPTATVLDDDALTRCTRVVIAEIERLTRLRDEVLDPRDEAEQRAAFHGEGVETDPELQLLRRYEAACQRRKAWALKQLRNGSAPSSQWSPPVPRRSAPPAAAPFPPPEQPAAVAEPPPIPPMQIGSVSTATAPETVADLLIGAPLSLLQGLRARDRHSETRGGGHEHRARDRF